MESQQPFTLTSQAYLLLYMFRTQFLQFRLQTRDSWIKNGKSFESDFKLKQLNIFWIVYRY